MSQATIEVLTGAAFLTGILAGATAFVVGWIGYLLFSTDARPLRAGGTILTVAALIAISVTVAIPTTLVLGLALLMVAGWLPLPVLFSPLLVLPGAVLIAFDGSFTTSDWVPWFVAGAIVLASPLSASFDRAYAEASLPLPMYGLAVVGLFFTVPDTEVAVVLLGTVLVGSFLGWPKPFLSMGRGGAYALVGLFLWVAAAGGAARPVTIIVAAGCLGLLLAEPIGRWISHHDGTLVSDGNVDSIVVLIAQLAIVFIISRVVADLTTVWMTAGATAAVLGVAAVGAAFGTKEPARRSERTAP